MIRRGAQEFATIDPADEREMAAANRAFHRAVWKASHNESLVDLLRAHNGKCELQLLLKRSSVDQAGQRVVVRMVGELLGPSS